MNVILTASQSIYLNCCVALQICKTSNYAKVWIVNISLIVSTSIFYEQFGEKTFIYKALSTNRQCVKDTIVSYFNDNNSNLLLRSKLLKSVCWHIFLKGNKFNFDFNLFWNNRHILDDCIKFYLNWRAKFTHANHFISPLNKNRNIMVLH